MARSVKEKSKERKQQWERQSIIFFTDVSLCTRHLFSALRYLKSTNYGKDIFSLTLSRCLKYNLSSVLSIHLPIILTMYDVYCTLYIRSLFYEGLSTGGGPTPFLPMGKMCHFPFFSIFPWEKMGEKYMEREGNEYFSLSFPIFPHGEKWEKTHFSHGQKWGWTPQVLHCIMYIYNIYITQSNVRRSYTVLWMFK